MSSQEQFDQEDTMQLKSAECERYRDQGFISLDPIIAADEVVRLQEIFDRLFSKPADGGNPLYFDLTGNDPEAELDDGSIPQMLHPSHHATELAESLAWHAALDIAMQLLDTGDCTRDDLIVRDHAIVKPPGSTGATPWHQDESYWDDDKTYQELSVWIALQETTEEMGCMQFIPGSHKGEVHPHHTWQNDPNIIALEIDDGCVDEANKVPCPLAAGGATVHHCRAAHYTSGNQSAVPRRAFILTIGTPPQALATPRNFYWNRKDRDYKKEYLTKDG